MVRKNGRQVLSHGDGIALGLFAQATNLLAVDEPVVAGAFDEGRIVFGLDRKQAIGAHHQVVDVASAVRHEKGIDWREIMAKHLRERSGTSKSRITERA